MWLVRLCFIALWASMAYAAVGLGPCKTMKPGHQVEKCSVKCNTDGSCSEGGEGEYCDCDGMAQFTSGSTDYEKNGDFSGTGGGSEACLEKLEKTCKDCKKGVKEFFYNASVTSKLQDFKKDSDTC